MRVGRFAPTPTGPLHMGSLVAALASFLDIKKNKGIWSIRIDDLDHPRNDPEAATNILECLKQHGLVSEVKTSLQSENLDNYESAMEALNPLLFRCNCSRKSVAKYEVYPGTCREKDLSAEDAAVRLKMPNKKMTFKDKIQGLIVTHLSTEVGDLILRRRDKIFSYNLATACDDGADRITDVLRGADLLSLTNQQIFLMNQLKLEPPEYSHIPVVCYPDGTKLSKQSGASQLNNKYAVDNLLTAMKFLGLEPPKYLAHIPNLLEWAIDHWSIENLPKNFQPYQ